MALDAVFVGSGINAWGRCSRRRAGACACSSATTGSAARSRRSTASPRRASGTRSSPGTRSGSAARLRAELKPDLDRLGLEYLNTDHPTASAFPDGSRASTSPPTGPRTSPSSARLAAPVRRVHGGRRRRLRRPRHRALVGQGFSLGRKAYKQFGRRGLVEFAGHSLLSARDWLTDTFDDERAHGLLAPWVLHTGLGPDQAMSGFMTQVIACALQLGGMPVPKGRRSPRRRPAAIVREAGGELRTEADVERIVVSAGKATAVRLATARRSARRARSRLRDADAALRAAPRDGRRTGARARARAPLPLRPRRDADPHRAERAAALARRRAPRADTAPPPRPGLDGVSRAVNEADRGLLPAGDDRARPADDRRPVARPRARG